MTKVHSAPGIPHEKSSTVSPVHGPGMDLPPLCGVCTVEDSLLARGTAARQANDINRLYWMRRDAGSMTRCGALKNAGSYLQTLEAQCSAHCLSPVRAL